MSNPVELRFLTVLLPGVEGRGSSWSKNSTAVERPWFQRCFTRGFCSTQGRYESFAWSLQNGAVQGSGQGFSFGDEALGGDLQSKDSAPAIEPDVPGMIPAVQVEAPGVGNQNTADPNLFATHQREGHALLPTRSGRKHRE